MMQKLPSWHSLAFCAACTVASGAFAAPTFDNIYLLGDSLSDQGNLFKATLTLRGAGVPANDHYFQGRFSNGEVYSGLLAQHFGLTLAASLNSGNNFAFGGTRTNYNIVENPPSPGGFPSGSTVYAWTLNLQRQAFAARNVSDPNALYVVFAGSNDVGDLIVPSIQGGYQSTLSASNAAVQGILDVVAAYKNAGARYILIPNIPDLGVVPRVASRNPLGSTLVTDTATALSRRFNDALDAQLDSVTGVQIIRFDTFSFFDQLHADPAAFGLSDATHPCYSGFVDPNPTATECATPNSYAYWDNEHPTTALHSLLADRMANAVTIALVPEPASWTLVAGGLAAAALGARRRDRATATHPARRRRDMHATAA